MLSCLPGAPSAPGCLAASGRQARLRQAAAGAPASPPPNPLARFRAVANGPMRENPGLAATVPVAPPLSRRGLRSWHPGKRPPGCKGQRRSQTALHVVAAGPCPLFCPVPFTCLSPCRRGQRQPQPSPPVQG
ncbi:hypothetical protein KBW66_26165 (plasmid) [Escherichia coli]|nr:hypothetical protein KBW66_26165 [Escherichia coli]